MQFLFVLGTHCLKLLQLNKKSLFHTTLKLKKMSDIPVQFHSYINIFRNLNTVCLRSSDPFYIVSYYIS